jgi:hypothetical protein
MGDMGLMVMMSSISVKGDEAYSRACSEDDVDVASRPTQNTHSVLMACKVTYRRHVASAPSYAARAMAWVASFDITPEDI